MPRRPRVLAESGIYHVMLRGVNREAIFIEDADRERFLQALAVVKDTSACQVLAYCLMTNHVHLVLRTLGEPIGLVLKRLGVRYAGWFNQKYGRVGHLFQDRFRSLPVEDDEYLVALLRYVWRNPVEAGLAGRPQDYRWSSRRLLGRSSPLVDEDELRRLTPFRALDQLAESPGPGHGHVLLGQPVSKPTDAQVSHIVEQACGASPARFAYLDAPARRRAVTLLRAASVPYRQIARVTGLSEATIRRLHDAA